MRVVSHSPEIQNALIAAAAACLTAWIAGTVSVLGLLISKEQEVSRFRQAWIDDLRRDIAEIIARIYQIHAYFHKSVPIYDDSFDYAAFWKATRDDYLELNRASIRVKLRVNRDENASALVLQSLNDIEQLFKDDLGTVEVAATLARIHTIVSALERDMPPLLKREWQRVKSGEPVYRFAKVGAIVLFSIAGISSVAMVIALLLRSRP
jgi:hypothetical protein